MPTKALTAKQVPTAMSVNVEANTESVLAIAVTRHEDLLEGQRVTLETNIKRLHKLKEDCLSSLEDMAKAQIRETHDVRLKELATLLADWGFEEVIARIEPINLDVKSKVITATCTLGAVDKTPCSYRYSASHDTLTTVKRVDASPAICAKIADLNKIEDELAKLMELHTEVRRALANIGRVERRARAALARKVLEATEEGQQMLATMEGVDSPFKGLLQLQAPELKQAESA